MMFLLNVLSSFLTHLFLKKVPVYNAKKHQIQVPQELSKIPDIFPRYEGDIPEYSLALVSYTVNIYTSTNGVHKNLFTVILLAGISKLWKVIGG